MIFQLGGSKRAPDLHAPPCSQYQPPWHNHCAYSLQTVFQPCALLLPHGQQQWHLQTAAQPAGQGLTLFSDVMFFACCCWAPCGSHTLLCHICSFTILSLPPPTFFLSSLMSSLFKSIFSWDPPFFSRSRDSEGSADPPWVPQATLRFCLVPSLMSDLRSQLAPGFHLWWQ